MKDWVLLFLAGGTGTAIRAGLDRLTSGGFPWGTLTVNLLGSFAIGVLATRAPEEWRWILGAGLLGGFTTFSAWSLQSVTLAQQGAWTSFTVFTILSPVAGVLLAWAGLTLFAR